MHRLSHIKINTKRHDIFDENIFPLFIYFSIFIPLQYFYHPQILAEPWIDTSNLYLKANIQLLADSGYISTPVTTYPLMWHDIIRDVKRTDTHALTDNQQNAKAYIMHQFKLASKNSTTVKASLAIKDSRFTSFGDTFRDKNSIQVQSSYMANHFAMKIAPSYNDSTLDGDKLRLDGSYIAAFWGNWLISYGKQDRWFGPTWDSSFSLTNNARPMAALALTRKSAIAFTIPFTEWHIPWTVTTFMGKMNDNRTINNTLLWCFRLNFKPIDNLEIGLTRLAQWGGDGRSKSLSTFGNILIGRTNCGVDDLVCDQNAPNPANQQAGYDIRYSMSWFDTPVTVYAQKFAEDGKEGTFNYVTKAQLQAGLDTHIQLLGYPTTAYIEYGDSLADCGIRDGIGDCYYEHSSYTTGMRFNRRSLGDLYENDASTYVLGLISQLGTNTHITNKLRFLELNCDNQDKAPNNPLIGNTLTSIAEDMLMVSSSLQHSYKNWRFTFSANVSHSTFDNDVDDETDINTSLTVEYNL